MDSHSVTPMSTDTNHYSKKKVKPSKGGWSAALFIIFVEVADRFAYYGLAGNLIMYLINVLNQPLAMAAKTVNTWVGVSSLFPLLGALLADSFLGRFKTILVSSAIYLAGSVLLTVSVSDAVSLSKREALFFVAIYVLAVGEGGHKPCVQTFAADQFDENLPNEKKAKSSFFNWWYLGIVFGSTAAVFVVIYIQDNISWTIGYGILTGVLVTAIAIFISGIKRYRKEVPIGSPFTVMAQVLVAAIRNWRVDPTLHLERVVLGSQSSDAKQLAACTEKYRFLNKATITDNRDKSTKNPWRVCSASQVEEVKLVIRLAPVWLSCLMFNVVQAQLHTFFTKQGSTMDRSIGAHFTLPPATLQGLVGLTILATVILYDRVFVPLARRRTGHPSGITTLQRIGFGLFLSILTMAVAALTESKRVRVAEENRLLDSPKSIVPIRVWWLFPQYMICGLSDTFEVVGLQELFYAEMPESMRSLGAAAHISIVGVGSFASSWIISLVEVVSSRAGRRWLGDNLNRSRLDQFYWVLAGMSAINLCVYLWVVKGFVYRESRRGDQEKLGDDDDNDDKGTKNGFVDGEV